jgi:hypothetical protein
LVSDFLKGLGDLNSIFSPLRSN